MNLNLRKKGVGFIEYIVTVVYFSFLFPTEIVYMTVNKKFFYWNKICMYVCASLAEFRIFRKVVERLGFAIARDHRDC